jgi:hypothetical protein
VDLRALNKVCFTICIVCIVIGVVLGLALIWVSQSSEFVWKGFATVGVVFLGAALTLSVSKTFEGKLRGGPRQE